MDELSNAFNGYIDEYKKLDIKSKREEFLNQLRDYVASLTVIANAYNVSVNYIKSREILDLKKDFVSENDFLEAAVVYLENSKNIIGQILEKIL